MSTPTLPDLARGLLKGFIVSLANAGLISGADAHNLITAMGLRDA